ncbi:MAG TPA: hypothetical protein ENH62_02510 [Marinobacter sp.]|nr:hypothetical protein [Marinobacter sp.]
MFKNVASQKIAVFAWDNANGVPMTGDAANITAQISIDGGVTAATNDVNPTELDATDAPGVYLFNMIKAETNGGLIILSAVSVTADIDLQPVFIYTQDLGAEFTKQMAESYAADGVAPTPAQALFLIQQVLTQFAIAGVTLTIKKLDGSTTAAVLTLDDDTNPTSADRTA